MTEKKKGGPLFAVSICICRYSLTFTPFKWKLGVDKEFDTLWVEYNFGPFGITVWAGEFL